MVSSPVLPPALRGLPVWALGKAGGSWLILLTNASGLGKGQIEAVAAVAATIAELIGVRVHKLGVAPNILVRTSALAQLVGFGYP